MVNGMPIKNIKKLFTSPSNLMRATLSNLVYVALTIWEHELYFLFSSWKTVTPMQGIPQIRSPIFSSQAKKGTNNYLL